MCGVDGVAAVAFLAVFHGHVGVARAEGGAFLDGHTAGDEGGGGEGSDVDGFGVAIDVAEATNVLNGGGTAGCGAGRGCSCCRERGCRF